MPRTPDVTLIQLRYFVKAASHLSMTKAADELRIAQSAVSAAVSQLEHQIGTQLFIRHRARGLVLTAGGEEMLRDTRALLDHLDEVLDGASGHVDQIRGRVRLACFVTLGPFILPRLIAQLGEEHPELHVDVIETEAHAMRTALRNGSAEVALTYDLGLGAGVASEVLGVARPYVALARDHPLAQSGVVDLADLADEPMVLLDLPESREYFEAMLHRSGRHAADSVPLGELRDGTRTRGAWPRLLDPQSAARVRRHLRRRNRRGSADQGGCPWSTRCVGTFRRGACHRKGPRSRRSCAGDLLRQRCRPSLVVLVRLFLGSSSDSSSSLVVVVSSPDCSDSSESLSSSGLVGLLRLTDLAGVLRQQLTQLTGFVRF